MGKAVVAVVGSAMMDLIAYSHVLPEPGETLIGDFFSTGFGGKGANQAAMAAKCGAEVHFIGKLGRDVFGDSIAENFTSLGIQTTYMERSDSPTGVAPIWVDGNGENRIIIIPGANLEIESKKAVAAVNSIADLSVVIAQCEIKQEVTLAAFRAAKARGCTTILNPAPFEPLSSELLELTDWLIPNETEFRELHGELPSSDQILQSSRPGKISIVTLGALGAVLVGADRSIVRIAAPVVNAVDTTGAGDSFAAGFISEFTQSHDSHRSLSAGAAIAARCVAIIGARPRVGTEV